MSQEPEPIEYICEVCNFKTKDFKQILGHCYNLHVTKRYAKIRVKR